MVPPFPVERRPVHLLGHTRPNPARAMRSKLSEPFRLGEDIMDATRASQERLVGVRVSFPGGKKVDADFGSRVIHTDQPASQGGGDTAPGPFDLFLASLATCAGFYVLSFCQTRGISTDGLELVQHHRFDETTHRLSRVELTITLPPGFPEKLRSAVVHAASGCKVKRLLMDPPEVVVTARETEASAGSSDSPKEESSP